MLDGFYKKRKDYWVKVVLDDDEVENLLYTYHVNEGGDPRARGQTHLGTNSLSMRLADCYFWRGMMKDIEEYVSIR